MTEDARKPLLGLIGLALAGAVMLFVTSAPPQPTHKGPDDAAKPAADKGANAPVKLVWKRDIGERAAPPEGAKNLLVINGCAVRKDALTAFGGLDDLTPHIDSLVASGAHFDDALTTATWTKPTLASLFTGQHGLELGIIEPEQEVSTRQMQPAARTLAEALVDQGWYTMAVNTNPGVTRQNSALWQGFDLIRDAHPTGWKAEHRFNSKQTANLAVRFMRQRPDDRPFYAHVLLTEGHKPIRVPQPEAKPWTEAGSPNGPYMATLKRTDDAVGIMLRYLEEEGLLEDTIVVFVSDHGEGLGQPVHHGPAHGRYMVPSVVQIPWVVSGPGIPAAHKVSGLASATDFAPTMLGVLGIEEPLADGIDGQNYSAPLMGQGSATDREVAWTDVWYHNANRAAVWTRDMMCQRDFGSGVVDNGPGDTFKEGCFHRQKDPEHHTTVTNAGLMERVGQWRAERPVINHPKRKPTAGAGPKEGGLDAIFNGDKKPKAKAPAGKQGKTKAK